ncbi:MAG: Crp/Fnr family transcriptional regulator [Hyphomicrobium sp.]
MFERRAESEDTCCEEHLTPQKQDCIASTLKLAQGETLFTVGTQRKCAYRVLSGGFCHYVIWPDGQHHVIEFVYTGDIIGFGHYQTYLTTAKALLDSAVVELSEAELKVALEKDPSLDARYGAAADREFEIIRLRSIGLKPRAPIQRLASYLSAMAQLGCKSGENCVQFPEKEGLKIVASLLEIRSSEIKTALGELNKRGLITKTSNCIVIQNQKALDQFVDTPL